MKRLFSGGPLSPKINKSEARSRSSSNSSLPPAPAHLSPSANDGISPEISPIITLLSAQTHRRYNEGIFMIIQSLDSEGNSIPNLKWREVYGILIGTQLAIWNIEELEKYQNDTEALLNASSKPDYLNFSDASFRHADTLEGNNSLKNVIIVSTTFKNQYLLQFNDLEDYHRWNSAFRLSTFEYTSLQESYTGSLLSSRGSKLSDIRTILAETKFDYEDWVSVRFGAGAKWKRCFAVIEQPTKKPKKGLVPKGMVTFYKDEKKNKKMAMAVIKDAGSAYALYPNSVKMIDHSTMIKLEGNVSFDLAKNALQKESTVYFMPEQHSAVPGYDTLIRFLIPLLNTFALYGRPKRLNANKAEKNSLLFGLPVLPHVHYLEIDDMILLSNNSSSSQWSASEWRDRIKEILARKVVSGYTGTGSSHGLIGALNSPVISSSEFFDNSKRPGSPMSPALAANGFRSQESSLKASSSNENLQQVSPGKSRNSAITQIYEDYSTFAAKSVTSDPFIDERPKKSTSPPQYQQPEEPVRHPVMGLDNKNSSKYSIPEIQINSPAEDSANKQKTLPADDEDDEFFSDDEILNNKLTALSMSKNNSNGPAADVFNPGYGASPMVGQDSPSRNTSPIKQGGAAAYTSGRINQVGGPSQHQQPQPQPQPQAPIGAVRQNPQPYQIQDQSRSYETLQQIQRSQHQQQLPSPPPQQHFDQRKPPMTDVGQSPNMMRQPQPPQHQQQSPVKVGGPVAGQQQYYQGQPIPPQHQQQQQQRGYPPQQPQFQNQGQQQQQFRPQQSQLHHAAKSSPYMPNLAQQGNPSPNPNAYQQIPVPQQQMQQRPPQHMQQQQYPGQQSQPRLPPHQAQDQGQQYNRPPPQQQQYSYGPGPQGGQGGQYQQQRPMQPQYPSQQSIQSQTSQYSQQQPPPQQQYMNRRPSGPGQAQGQQQQQQLHQQHQSNPYAQGNPYQR
ncbi:hypothetical protein WICPIJ_003388 [Wickerhamomyces pijperi]|uniref:PH domain-containing protein n=1 Tax=Wickerhamomyces pijperi TaxID=599730 RepID=A0A9P8TP99_WICPI|nr:hypothetical protein WICPIJ_003388 [Wickerhamomyces pijperi]